MTRSFVINCDLGHDNDPAPARPITFSLERRTYVVDLCEQHRGSLIEVLAPYVAAARRQVGGAPSGGGPCLGRCRAPRCGPGRRSRAMSSPREAVYRLRSRRPTPSVTRTKPLRCLVVGHRRHARRRQNVPVLADLAQDSGEHHAVDGQVVAGRYHALVGHDGLFNDHRDRSGGGHVQAGARHGP